jgi:hypothetical protein
MNFDFQQHSLEGFLDFLNGNSFHRRRTEARSPQRRMATKTLRRKEVLFTAEAAPCFYLVS